MKGCPALDLCRSIRELRGGLRLPDGTEVRVLHDLDRLIVYDLRVCKDLVLTDGHRYPRHVDLVKLLHHFLQSVLADLLGHFVTNGNKSCPLSREIRPVECLGKEIHLGSDTNDI